MSTSWGKGSTRRWRVLRKAVLDANTLENGGRCQLAIPGVCDGQATQVHHVRGKHMGDSPVDLMPACAPCNRHVGQPGRSSPEPRPVSRW